MPLDKAVEDADDSVSQRNIEAGERALLYVALTRARRSAMVTAYGEISPYLTTTAAASVVEEI